MDAINESIINELRQNARITTSQISKRVNLSIPAVSERIRKMEQTGLIEKYTVKVNRMKVNKNLLAFIFVSIDQTENIAGFRKQIVQYECVLECHHLAGEEDYLLKVVVENTDALESFLTNTLKKITGVCRSTTHISLMTLKEELF